MECWTQHILFSLHRWEMVDLIQESLITGTAVICERYAWSGVVYSYVSNPRMPLEAYMTCDQWNPATGCGGITHHFSTGINW